MAKRGNDYMYLFSCVGVVRIYSQLDNLKPPANKLIVVALVAIFYKPMFITTFPPIVTGNPQNEK